VTGKLDLVNNDLLYKTHPQRDEVQFSY